MTINRIFKVISQMNGSEILAIGYPSSITELSRVDLSRSQCIEYASVAVMKTISSQHDIYP